MTFELFFKLLAATLGAVAACFVWQGNTDATFVAIVLAAVSYLLSLRIQIKAKMKQREAGKPEDILRK